MKQENFEILYDSLAESVEDISQFYRTSEEDTNRYWLGPDLINSVVWTLSTIVVPIIVGVSKDYFSDLVKKKFGDSNSKKAKEEYKIIIEIKQDVKEKKGNIDLAIEEAEKYFMRHGLPQKKAKRKAEEVVHLLENFFYE